MFVTWITISYYLTPYPPTKITHSRVEVTDLGIYYMCCVMIVSGIPVEYEYLNSCQVRTKLVLAELAVIIRFITKAGNVKGYGLMVMRADIYDTAEIAVLCAVITSTAKVVMFSQRFSVALTCLFVLLALG